MEKRKPGRPAGAQRAGVEKLFGLLQSLDSTPRGAFASNAFIVEQMGCSVRTVQRYLDILVREGRITRTLAKFLKGAQWLTWRAMQVIKGAANPATWGIPRPNSPAVGAIRDAEPTPRQKLERAISSVFDKVSEDTGDWGIPSMPNMRVLTPAGEQVRTIDEILRSPAVAELRVALERDEEQDRQRAAEMADPVKRAAFEARLARIERHNAERGYDAPVNHHPLVKHILEQHGM